MSLEPDITIEIQLTTTEAGGRQTQTPKDAFGCLIKLKDEYHDCRLLLNNTGALSPGQKAVVPVKFLRPELLVNCLKEGQEFTLCEGQHIIGNGKVVKLLWNAEVA